MKGRVRWPSLRGDDASLALIALFPCPISCEKRCPMNRWCCFVSLLLSLMLALVVGSVSTAADPEKPRNPFDVKDVPDPDGEDVKAFAAKTELPADDKDDNARQWAEKATEGKPGSLAGEWSSRWNGGSAKDWVSGTATVKPVGDRVYILYKDDTGTYLIDARRDGKKRLVGRYVNVNEPSDSSPWIGVIVGDERIDGIWSEGRWDMRRKVTPEKKPD
jgi:hypothetical protein